MAHGCPQRLQDGLALGLGFLVLFCNNGCMSNISSKRDDAQSRLPLPSALPPPSLNSSAASSSVSNPSTNAPPPGIASPPSYQRPGPATQVTTTTTTFPGGISGATMPTTMGTHVPVMATTPSRTPIAVTPANQPAVTTGTPELPSSIASTVQPASAIPQPAPPTSISTASITRSTPTKKNPAKIIPTSDRWNSVTGEPIGGLRNFTPQEPALVSTSTQENLPITPPDGKAWIHEVPSLPMSGDTPATAPTSSVILPPGPLSRVENP
mgnify:CR=1 FL=1